jgi:hypothetical protein
LGGHLLGLDGPTLEQAQLEAASGFLAGEPDGRRPSGRADESGNG